MLHQLFVPLLIVFGEEADFVPIPLYQLVKVRVLGQAGEDDSRHCEPQHPRTPAIDAADLLRRFSLVQQLIQAPEITMAVERRSRCGTMAFRLMTHVSELA